MPSMPWTHSGLEEVGVACETIIAKEPQFPKVFVIGQSSHVTRSFPGAQMYIP